jgi:hypothetical protein
MTALAIRLLNWLTNMHWSSSPNGMGCVHQQCPTWKQCGDKGECLDFGKRDAVTTGHQEIK